MFHHGDQLRHSRRYTVPPQSLYRAHTNPVIGIMQRLQQKRFSSFLPVCPQKLHRQLADIAAFITQAEFQGGKLFRRPAVADGLKPDSAHFRHRILNRPGKLFGKKPGIDVSHGINGHTPQIRILILSMSHNGPDGILILKRQTGGKSGFLHCRIRMMEKREHARSRFSMAHVIAEEFKRRPEHLGIFRSIHVIVEKRNVTIIAAAGQNFHGPLTLLGRQGIKMAFQSIFAGPPLDVSARVHRHAADEFIPVQQSLFQSLIISDAHNALEGMLKKLLLPDRIRSLDQPEYGSCRGGIHARESQPLQNHFHGVLILVIQRRQHVGLQLVQLLRAEQTQGIRPQNPDDGLKRLDAQGAAGFVEIGKQHGSALDAVDLPQCVQHGRGDQRRTSVQSVHQNIHAGTILDFRQSFHHGVLNPFLIIQRLPQAFHSLRAAQLAKTHRRLITHIDFRIVQKHVAQRGKSHGTVGRPQNIRNENTDVGILIIQESGQCRQIVHPNLAQNIHGDIAYHGILRPQQRDDGPHRRGAANLTQCPFGRLLHAHAAVCKMLHQQPDGALQTQVSGIKGRLPCQRGIFTGKPFQDVLFFLRINVTHKKLS